MPRSSARKKRERSPDKILAEEETPKAKRGRKPKKQHETLTKLNEQNLTVIEAKQAEIIKTRVNELKERLKLSSAPESLPCREVEFYKIKDLIESALNERKGTTIYIAGVPGTGKTETVRRVLKDLEKRDDFKYLELNGMELNDPTEAYTQVWKLIRQQNYAAPQAHGLLENYFLKSSKKRKMLVVVLDELDLMVQRKQNVVYNFLNWPTRKDSNLVVLSISNTMDLPERVLANKISSRAGLSRVNFEPYSWQQLFDILKDRVKGYEDLIEPSALQLCARKVGSVSGDARRTLGICSRSLDLELDKADFKKVDCKTVEKALDEMYQSTEVQAVTHCTLQQKIFLYAITSVLRSTGLYECTFEEAANRHIHLCKTRKFNEPNFYILGNICFTLGQSRIIISDSGPRNNLLQKIRFNVSQDDVMVGLKTDDRLKGLLNNAAT